MAWKQLHIHCNKPQAEMVESLLWLDNALSVSLDDAGDQPLFEPLPGESPLWDNVIITGLFQATDDTETIGQHIAQQLQITRIWTTPLADQVWETAWMEHYHPIECANNLWVVPKWLTPPNANATNIMMDAGLAFGTGYHATTRLCLDWLSEQNLTGKTLIDYGSGSGILAIAALKLGAKKAYAIDIDPQAVLASQQNASINHVETKLWSGLPHEFDALTQTTDWLKVDLITANILAKPLIELAPRFATLVKESGTIVLAGLIKEQVKQVKTAYAPWFNLTAQGSYPETPEHHWQRLSGYKC